MSRVWAVMNQELGTKMHLTTAYHPASNGLVERQHRKMKDALKSRLEGRPDWHRELWAVLLGMRTAPRDDIGASTAELVFGMPITVPGDLVEPREFKPASPELLRQVRQAAAGRTPVPSSAHTTPTSHTPKDLASCPYVFVRVDKVVNPLASKYTGPYKVLERSERAFKLDYTTDPFGKDLHEWVTMERLKPAYLDHATFGPDGPPAPARKGRGRPRKDAEAPPAQTAPPKVKR